MKVLAYVAIDYVYFTKLIPRLQQEVEVVPIVVYEMLHKLGGSQVTRAEWGMFLDYMLVNEKPDAIWCYALPDEETLAAGRRHRIPVLIQEYYGHYPYNLSGILPYGADWNAFYQVGPEPEETGRRNEWPNITISLSEAFYPASDTIPIYMESYKPGGASSSYPFWQPNGTGRDFVDLTMKVINFCRGNKELSQCPIRVRLHPRYPERFRQTAEAVEAAGDPLSVIDRSTVAESLDWTDVVVHVNSNYGFDAIRAGGEVISAGGFAFFDNPLYSHAVRTPEALQCGLEKAAQKIRTKGKVPRPFVSGLLHDLEKGGQFYHPCLEPYESGNLSKALACAAKVPRLTD